MWKTEVILSGDSSFVPRESYSSQKMSSWKIFHRFSDFCNWFVLTSKSLRKNSKTATVVTNPARQEKTSASLIPLWKRARVTKLSRTWLNLCPGDNSSTWDSWVAWINGRTCKRLQNGANNFWKGTTSCLSLQKMSKSLNSSVISLTLLNWNMFNLKKVLPRLSALVRPTFSNNKMR